MKAKMAGVALFAAVIIVRTARVEHDDPEAGEQLFYASQRKAMAAG